MPQAINLVVAELLRNATTRIPQEMVILFYFLVLSVTFLRLSILDFSLLTLYFSYLTFLSYAPKTKACDVI